MMEHFIRFFNVIVTFYACHVLVLYPMWRTLGWKRRGTLLYITCLTLYLSIATFISMPYEMDIQAFQVFKLYITIPTLLLAVVLFRKQILQIVFCIILAFMYGPITAGISAYASENWFAPYTYPLLPATVITLITAVITLPPLLFILRRLFENPDMKNAVKFWRFVWLLPTLFFSITLISSSYMNALEKNIGFIVFRVFIYIAILLTCYLLESAVRQASEAEISKRKAEEQAAKTNFYREMSHSLRTPLTKISTNIQIANRQENTDHERLEKSQDEIMHIAEMIDKALDDSDESEADK